MLKYIHVQLIENDPYIKKPHDKASLEKETSPQINKMDHHGEQTQLGRIEKIR